MITTTERINNAVDDGLANFWMTIKERFPEIFTGDLSVDATVELERICREIVGVWYHDNLVGCHTPSATYHALKQLKEEFPALNVEDTSYRNDASDSITFIVDGNKKVRVWMQNVEREFNDFTVVELDVNEEWKNEVEFTDFQQVVDFIRLTYTKAPTKPPRKPILWMVFDASDTKEIADATGLQFGNELPDRTEDMVSVLFSSGNQMWVILNNKGQYFTIAGNDSCLGTLAECIKCMDGFETVE